MTRRPKMKPDPLAGFLAALAAYKAAFQDSPATLMAGPDELDQLAPAMWEAIRRGRPLTAQECADVMGVGLPPDGACW